MNEGEEKRITELSEADVMEERAPDAESLELKKSFASELRAPEKGSYLKKLRRLGGALALAGITAFSPMKKEAVAPETTEEFSAVLQYQKLEDMKNENKELFKRVETYLKNYGGVRISPQLETIYKIYPKDTRIIAQGMQHTPDERPYFSRPEVILGKKFIEENPREARAYLDKIKKTMEATVLIEGKEYKKMGGNLYSRDVFGSGVILETAKGPVVLTAAHLAKAGADIWVTLENGTFSFRAKTEFANQETDLAVLAPPSNLSKILKEYKITPLKVGQMAGLKPNDRLATIGHPTDFPFEVGISKFDSYIDGKSIGIKPDPRFAKLATYPDTGLEGENWPLRAKKGDILPGMSGGPVIKLDSNENEPKLIGLNKFVQMDETSELRGGAVSASDIQNFLNAYTEYKSHPEKFEY